MFALPLWIIVCRLMASLHNMYYTSHFVSLSLALVCRSSLFVCPSQVLRSGLPGAAVCSGGLGEASAETPHAHCCQRHRGWDGGSASCV